jgi:lipid A ethanolaminephosphotransferase
MMTRHIKQDTAISHKSRLNLSITRLILVLAIGNAIFYQWPLYSFAFANINHSSVNGILTLATLFFLVAFVTILVLSLISLISHRLLKPVCMLGAMCNSLALYFIQTYQVVLDKSMMGNVFNTNISEASSFFHIKLLAYLLVLGVLPCWLISKVRIEKVRRVRQLLFLSFIFFIGIGWFYANAKTWLWIDKNASRLGGMIMPWSYVFNTTRYYSDHLMISREQTLLPASSAASNEKTVVILVIGESARAQNFSLYGYQRPTNPLLAELGIITLPNSHSCATYTTASLLCILSHIDTSRHFSQSFEPLPSYLARHDIDVIWRTNNWGEPPLKVQTYQRAEDLRRDCRGDSCGYDEVLLQGLAQRIRSSTHEKIFVILHQSGSHGPSYYTKYPKQFEVFKPACKSVDLRQCTNEELVNAYDNTVLYTDHFLAQAIDLLKTFSKTATMLMYISDHGESLGEGSIWVSGS